MFNFCQNNISIEKDFYPPPKKFNKLKNILINIFSLYFFNLTVNRVCSKIFYFQYKIVKYLFIFLFMLCIRLAAQDMQSIQNSQDIQNTEQGSNNPASDISEKWYSNLFASAGFQTFIPISLLKDYTKPKPGYRAAFGYTFFRSKQHTMPVYLETGHSVILGTNPLVRSFDAVPITVNTAYDYFPIRHLSVGAFAGIGLYVLQIQHYQTAVDLLTDKMKISQDVDGVFSTGISIGSNILNRSIEFKAAFSIDLLLEKSRAVPLPSFQIYVRFYPADVYAYARRKNKPVPVIIEKEIEVPAEKQLAQFDAIYVYFTPESAELDVNAKGDIKKAAAILKENKDISILFESSAAPFGSQSGRLKIEAERIEAVSGYLQKNGITQDRIIYNEPKDKNHKKEDMPEEEFYTRYRYVKIRFVRLQFNPNEGANLYQPVHEQPDEINGQTNTITIETTKGENK